MEILDHELATARGRRDDPPVLRVSQLWGSNYSWVDLWIEEPDGGRVWWNREKGTGKIRGCWIQGYGPQVYEGRQPGAYSIVLDLYSTDETEVEEDCLSSVVVEQKDRRTGAIVRQHHLVVMSAGNPRPVIATVLVP